MKKILVVISLLVAALFCYLAGSTAGMATFILAGIIFEILFYFEVFELPKKTKTNKNR